MPRDPRLRIQDMLDAIERVESYVTGMSLAELVDDIRTHDAVLYNLYIVGEAATNLPESVTGEIPEIPWSKIRKFRNFMAHGYFHVEPEAIWVTITQDLPPLKGALAGRGVDEP